MRGRVNIGHAKVSAKERAEELVAKAAAVTFPPDPLFGPELSRAISVVSSVVRRHGLEIQGEIARSLKTSGRFEVFTNIELPMPAREGRLTRRFCVDLLAINPGSGWVGVYEVKRGLGSTDTARRRQLEADLLSLRAALPAIALELGFYGIRHSTSAIISYFDVASFAQELILRRADLDDHFGVAVTAAVDGLTREIGLALQGVVPILFGRPASEAAPTAEIQRPIGPDQSKGGSDRLLTSRSARPRLTVLGSDGT